MRVAIYARVSTEDKGQDPETSFAGERKQFGALFEDASGRKFDCVLFWALDRFSREGMVPTIQHLEQLNSYGVMFHSYTEPHLCVDNEMVRGILLAVLATMGKPEAKRLSERVIAVMRKAQASTRRLVRLASAPPPFSAFDPRWGLLALSRKAQAPPRREALTDRRVAVCRSPATASFVESRQRATMAATMAKQPTKRKLSPRAIYHLRGSLSAATAQLLHRHLLSLVGHR